MDALQTLTILKTDVARFTQRVEQLSAADLDRFLDDHRRLLTPIVHRHGGHVVKELGDALLATFSSSTQALRAATAMQREVAEDNHRRPADAAVEIRIAVTAGDVVIQGGDVFGTPVNAAARIEEITPPGQIYFSEAVYRNLAPNEIAAELVNTLALKGIAEPQRIYRTAFRHQTRILRDAVVTIADLSGFTHFAENGHLADVEDTLEFWDDVNRHAAAGHRGIIRAVLADAYVVTFESVPDAAAAWKTLAERFVAHQLAADPARFPVDFGLGLAAGDIRLFRSALYGRAVNTADRNQTRSRSAGPGCLCMESSLLPRLAQPFLDTVHVVALATDPCPAPGPDLPGPCQCVALRLK